MRAAPVADADVLLRRKQVAAMLSISRSTLRRIEQRDPTFPRFWQLTVGVHVVAEGDVQRWLRVRQFRVSGEVGAT